MSLNDNAKKSVARVKLANDDGQTLEIDANTRSQINIDYPHHEQHEGNTWSASNLNASLLNAGVIEIIITVGPNKEFHSDYVASCGGDATVELFEGPSEIVNGTNLIFRNRNRDFGDVGIQSSAILNPTSIGEDGTLLEPFLVAGGTGGNSPGGSGASRKEWILKPGLRYLFRMTNISGQTKPASFEVVGYEHTDKSQEDVEPTILFTTDFSEYVISTPPVDWLERLNEGSGEMTIRDDGAIGTNALEMDISQNDDIYVSTWNKTGQHTDVEILCKWRLSELAIGSSTAFVCARVTGEDGGENFYGIFIAPSANEFRVGKFVSGLFTALESKPKTWVLNKWQWTRFSVVGTELKCKIWDDGSEEPASWDIEQTDGDLTNGHFGLGGNRDSADWDYVAVDKSGTTIELPE